MRLQWRPRIQESSRKRYFPRQEEDRILEGPCVIHSQDGRLATHTTSECYNWKEIEKLKLATAGGAATTDKGKDDGETFGKDAVVSTSSLESQIAARRKCFPDPSVM